nr:glycosyltransferase [uncultured Flavobacterium sp.]
MIIVYHQHNKVTSVFDFERQLEIGFSADKISKILMDLAQQFPDRLIMWCHESVKELLNIEAGPELFHHRKLLLSYTPSHNYLPDAIGYADETVFINVNKNVSYPTWQQSVLVGGTAAAVLLAVKDEMDWDENFDYFLISMAKLVMPLGVFCYSEPKLLRENANIKPSKQASIATLFRFVKQHYRIRWVFLLLMNFFLYEQKLPFFAFITAFFYRRRKLSGNGLTNMQVTSSRQVVEKRELDVIIPTMGRKVYLHDVLKDFARQTVLPKKIIIVEQNPLANSETELDYIVGESWPFPIKHVFIHQTGACNARNLALNELESEWVFMADDDIRFSADFVETAFAAIENTGNKAFTLSCLREGEQPQFLQTMQWGTFGSGCSIVKTKALQSIKFNMSYEFGFGEDADFGMQLRNHGKDIIYLPQPEIVHLKAPVGGFRTKAVLAWQNEEVQPKPSPSVMFFRKSHHTKEQLYSYKTNLFCKYYFHQSIKNPFKYLKNMEKQWKRSLYWAEKLSH